MQNKPVTLRYFGSDLEIQKVNRIMAYQLMTLISCSILFLRTVGGNSRKVEKVREWHLQRTPISSFNFNCDCFQISWPASAQIEEKEEESD